MKRLSKSATDLSPCRRKSRTNSDDDEYQEKAESAHEPEIMMTTVNTEECQVKIVPRFLLSLLLAEVQLVEVHHVDPLEQDQDHIIERTADGRQTETAASQLKLRQYKNLPIFPYLDFSSKNFELAVEIE